MSAFPKSCLHLQLWSYFSLFLYWIIFPFRGILFPLARLGPLNPFAVTCFSWPLPQNVSSLVIFVPKHESTVFFQNIGTHLQDYKRVSWPVWPQYDTPLLITYLFTPWSRVLLEKLTGSKLAKKFPAFYGTQRFITSLTSARHLSLFPLPEYPSRYYPLIYASGFSTKPVHATWPAHLILLDLITRTIFGKGYRFYLNGW